MDFNAQVELLKAAEGDPARLALATVDLLLAARPADERERVREALEAAAVPHWFDEKIVGALLEIPAADAVTRMVRLRELNVVESFPARGPGTKNVHQEVRVALRARLAKDDPERLRLLSSRARNHFAADPEESAAIEALYHRFIAEPAEAVADCGALFDEWDEAGRYASLLALRTILEELLDSSPSAVPPGLVRGAVLYYLGRIRFRYPRMDDRLGTTEELARTALAEYQAGGEASRVFQARNLLGDVLHREGNAVRAIKEYQTAIDLAQREPVDSGDEKKQRDVSVAYDKISRILRESGRIPDADQASRRSREIRNLIAVPPPDAELERDLWHSAGQGIAGDMLHQQGNFSGALASFRAVVAIRERLAAKDPENAHWQSDLAASHNRLGNVLLDQGDLRAAIGAFRAGMAVIESLANRYPSNAEWQKDFANACARIAKLLLRLPDGNRMEAGRLVARGRKTIAALARAHPLTAPEQAVQRELHGIAAPYATLASIARRLPKKSDRKPRRAARAPRRKSKKADAALDSQSHAAAGAADS